jgi:hypothetical protein
MSRIYVAKGSSAVNAPFGLGITGAEGNNRNIKILGYSVASRGADFAADVQIDLMAGYSGLNGTDLAFTGTESLGTAVYDASLAGAWDTDADSWVEKTDGDLTFTGNIDKTDGAATAKTNCLRILADAGGDPFSLQRAGTTTNNLYYKATFWFMQDTGAGISFLGLGSAGDAWDETYDHDGGSHHTCGDENTWELVTLYGKADGTALELAGFTTKNGNTEDTLAGTKNAYLQDFKLYQVTDAQSNLVSDWVPSAETHFGWHGADAGFSCDAGNGGTLTWTATGEEVATSGDLYKIVVTQADYVAQNITITGFGDAAFTLPAADGTYTIYCESDGTDTVILTADGTGDADVKAISIQKVMGSGGTGLANAGVTTVNSLYHHTIQNGDVQGKDMIPFPGGGLPVGNAGWWMQFTPGGASSILDVNVFYEIR